MNTILLKDVNRNVLAYTGIVYDEDYFYPSLYIGGTHHPAGTAKRRASYFVTIEVNGCIVWYCDTAVDIEKYITDKIECYFKHFFSNRDEAIECAHNLKRTDQILLADKLERAKINT